MWQKRWRKRKINNSSRRTSTWDEVLRTLSEEEHREGDLIADRIKETTTAEMIKPYDHEEIMLMHIS